MSILIATAGSGAIEGGMGFVWAAYSVTWLFFAGYGLSLFLRGREEA